MEDLIEITANGPYQGRIGKVVMIYYDIEHTGSSDDLLYVELDGRVLRMLSRHVRMCEEGENAC